MGRARNIKPQFFENEDLAECSPHARLLFIGLWTQADKEGRLEYRPKRIKAKAFPYEDVEIEELLEELRAARFVSIYRVNDLEVLQVENFVRHQNPHKNEKDSDLPVPEEATDDAGSSGIPENSRNYASDPEEIGTARADSPLLIPDSPIPPSASGDAPAVVQLRMSRGEGDAPKPAMTFDEFWDGCDGYDGWPNKVAKQPARKSWSKLSAVQVAKVRADLVDRQRLNRDPQWRRWIVTDDFALHATTYLNQSRFDDEWTPVEIGHDRAQAHQRGPGGPRIPARDRVRERSAERIRERRGMGRE